MTTRINTTTAYAYATDTVGSSAKSIESGSLFTAEQLATAEWARVTCLTNAVCFTYHGSDPTANSHYLTVGAEVQIVGNANIKNLRFIRAGASDGRVTITLEQY